MNIESFREYCLSKKGVSESFPFDDTTLVFKVLDKMFTLTDIEDTFKINLKFDEEKALELREQYEAVIPGYHMSKKYWNTIIVDGSIPDNMLQKWIDGSYNIVVSKMPKYKQKKLLED